MDKKEEDFALFGAIDPWRNKSKFNSQSKEGNKRENREYIKKILKDSERNSFKKKKKKKNKPKTRKELINQIMKLLDVSHKEACEIYDDMMMKTSSKKKIEGFIKELKPNEALIEFMNKTHRKKRKKKREE